MRIQRKSVSELLSETPGPEGVIVPIDYFEDLADQHNPNEDRVVIGTSKPSGDGIDVYTGTLVVEDENVFEFKRYMAEILANPLAVREVRIMPPRHEGGKKRVVRSTIPVEELVSE